MIVVLFNTVGLLSCMCALQAVATEVVRQTAQMQTLASSLNQCYFMARSVARLDIQSVRDGTLTPGSFQVPYPDGTVTQNISHSGTWSFKITARSTDSADTITFTYNPATNTILTWQDNGVS